MAAKTKQRLGFESPAPDQQYRAKERDMNAFTLLAFFALIALGMYLALAGALGVLG